MEAGMWRLTLIEREGFTLVAPMSFANANEDLIEERTGGCGPGNIGDWFVPDTMYGESVYLACQIHDWMYSEGKTLKDKRVADLVFLVNMTLLVTADSGMLDVLRLRRVMSYFQAVYMGGNDAFQSGKTMKREG